MAQERPPLEEMTLRQLRRVASEYNISRYSRMRKSELVSAVASAMQVAAFTTAPRQSLNPILEEQTVEASKFELGQDDKVGAPLTQVDAGLGDLPGGYGESRIVLLPRDPQWAYAYWDVSNEHKEELRRQGGQQLTLRLYDVTDLDWQSQSPHSVQEYACDELAREWYLPIPVSDRDYALDIGYRTFDGRWLVLARSAPIRIPPVYPSDWVEDVFITVNWDEDLKGRTLYQLVPPSKRVAGAEAGIYDQVFDLAQSAEAQRLAGSLYGSMQHVPGSMAPEQVLSSYVFPSGMGMWGGVPTLSGITGLSALTLSGMGMGSGLGAVSSAEFMSSEAPNKPRKFWLVADAELIVYGATEPDATVTIGGRPIKLNPDGTFRFQMSFQDGLIDYPIMAVAVDGEQTRSIHMKFNRETPSRHTNTKEEAVLEWPV
ncbi:MAG: DUF4912 domain-containing protein [Cyanobacteriota bacterium]|jgi:hypothetical protein